MDFKVIFRVSQCGDSALSVPGAEAARPLVPTGQQAASQGWWVSGVAAQQYPYLLCHVFSAEGIIML